MYPGLSIGNLLIGDPTVGGRIIVDWRFMSGRGLDQCIYRFIQREGQKLIQLAPFYTKECAFEQVRDLSLSPLPGIGI